MEETEKERHKKYPHTLATDGRLGHHSIPTSVVSRKLSIYATLPSRSTAAQILSDLIVVQYKNSDKERRYTRNQLRGEQWQKYGRLLLKV